MGEGVYGRESTSAPVAYNLPERSPSRVPAATYISYHDIRILLCTFRRSLFSLLNTEQDWDQLKRTFKTNDDSVIVADQVATR